MKGEVLREKKMTDGKKLSYKVIYEAFKILKENGGEMKSRDVVEEIKKRVQFTEWEKEVYEKTGNIRWWSTLQFASISCAEVGYIVKKNRKWYLTPEGEKALELGPEELLESANKLYWDKKRDEQVDSQDSNIEDEITPEETYSLLLESIHNRASEELEEFIKNKNPYEFQDIVAALLRGMGYHVPFVAPRGKDGGIDVIAYQDPLGAKKPRIVVQVKHRENSATVQEIRQLSGILQRDGDIGLFISSGGFTRDSESTARSSHIHIELIDLDKFIDLWKQYYKKMSDEDKKLIPLTSIYFLSRSE